MTRRGGLSCHDIAAAAVGCSGCLALPDPVTVAAEEARHQKLLSGSHEIRKTPFLAPARHSHPEGDETGGILDGFFRRQCRADGGQEHVFAEFQRLDHRLAPMVLLPRLANAALADRLEGIEKGGAVAIVAAGAGKAGVHRDSSGAPAGSWPARPGDGGCATVRHDDLKSSVATRPAACIICPSCVHVSEAGRAQHCGCLTLV